MKVCPDCRYNNPDHWEKCEVCGRDLQSVADAVSKPPVSPVIFPAGYKAVLLASGLVVCVTSVVALYTVLPRRAAQAPRRLMASPLLKSLDDANAPARAGAAGSLAALVLGGGEYPPETPERLLRALSDSSHMVRAEAAQSLSDILEKTAARRSAGFAAALGSADYRAEFEAAASELLTDGFPEVRANAARLCGATGASRLKAPLKKLLASERDLPVALRAAGALVRLGDPAGADYLIFRFGDGDEAVRELSAQLLGRAGGARADRALEKLAADDSAPVRRAALAALEYRRRMGENRGLL